MLKERKAGGSKLHLMLDLQVVTTARRWAEQESSSIIDGFDQEAAMAMMARWMNFK